MSDLVYRGPVTGLSYSPDYAKLASEIKANELVKLIPVDNDFDPHAVGIFYKGKRIGWIPKEKSNEVKSELSKARVNDKKVVARIINYDPCADFNKKLYILVAAEEQAPPIEKHKPAANIDQCVEVICSTPSSFQNDPLFNCASDFLASLTNEKEQTMTSSIVNKNVSLAGSAAMLEAGSLANKAITKLVSKKAPVMVRGYVDTPLGRLVTANLAQLALQQFRPGDVRLQKLTDAMILTAYQELISTIDLDSMLDQLLDDKQVKKALDKVSKD